MLWWGAGVHVKSDTGGVYESDGSQDEKLHVVDTLYSQRISITAANYGVVNYVNVDDEQNESDEDDGESGEECFEGNGEQDQLGNQGDNDDGEQDEDVICKVGFAMHKCSR